MHTLARFVVVPALAASALVATLTAPAHAKVLAVSPTSPFAVAAPRAEAAQRRTGRLWWILRHMDGGGALRPLAPVDQSSGRPASLGSSWAVRLKFPF